MKQIYPIAIYQDIEYKVLLLPIKYNYWVIGHLHYILAETEKEAIEIYKNNYKTNYDKEIGFWNIEEVSKNYYSHWSDRRVKVLSNIIINCEWIKPSTEDLFKNMDIQDFKEWLNLTR